eukprot:c6402_g1_i1 orf=84-410(-)
MALSGAFRECRKIHYSESNLGCLHYIFYSILQVGCRCSGQIRGPLSGIASEDRLQVGVVSTCMCMCQELVYARLVLLLLMKIVYVCVCVHINITYRASPDIRSCGHFP